MSYCNWTLVPRKQGRTLLSLSLSLSSPPPSPARLPPLVQAPSTYAHHQEGTSFDLVSLEQVFICICDKRYFVGFSGGVRRFSRKRCKPQDLRGFEQTRTFVVSRGRFAASGLCRRNERRRNTLLNNFTPMHVKTVLHSYGVRRKIFYDYTFTFSFCRSQGLKQT